MRPVRLDFKGLRSYRAATTIDFSDLDLFAIIGDTGAGKSTVIEALSLALYGRKTWTGGSNLEELIADGENTMAIELTFVAEGNEWVVTRSRHRNSSAPVNKLECRVLGEKVDGNRAVNERIEELLGLDHSQFVRAVVLPQGRFDELLQATRTDRNKILRSIFGLDDLRRVRDDATRRRDGWRPVLLEARAKRDALPPDPAGALAAAVVHADTAEARQAKLAEIIADAEQHEAVVRQAGEQLTALDRAATSFAPDPSVLDPLGDLARRGAQLLAEREQLTATQREAEARRDAAVESQAALLRGFADQQQARGAISLLRSSSAILAELDDEAERVEAELAQLRADAPSPDEPAAITDVVTSAAAEVARATEQLSEANQRLDEASAAWLSLGELGDHVAKNRLALDEAQSAADTARAEAAVAGASVATAEAALAAAKAEQQEAMRTNAAVVAAQGIAAGDPCPVCRQATPHDFAPPVAADVDAAAQHVEAAEATVAAARRAVTAADTTATHRAEALAAARDALDRSLVAVGEARAAVVALSLDPDATDADVALGAVRLVVDSAREALDAATATASAAERQQIAAAAERTAALAAHERDLAACQRRQEQIGARRASQRTQLDGLPEAWFIGSDAPTAELEARAAAIESMVIELEALVAAAAAADADAAAAKQRFAELRAEAVETVNTPVGDIVRLLNEQVTTAAQLQPFLADATGSDPLPEPLPTPVLLDQLETLVPAARELVDRLQPVAAAVATARGQLALQQQAAAAALSALLESAGVADAGSLHAQAGAARAEAARARADIEVLERQVAAADGLDAMLDIGQPYLANLELLIQSLRDQHFVDHLVSMREVELLGEATRRLKAISNGRYGFVPDFGVVRIASGEVRSPDTLSGGERFQAALALALALVEIASRGAGKLDAVFVDEGFGSLDGAALDVALDTLGSVAGGGKLVALISHLHPVAEYVDTVFSVTKDDLFGSTITKLDAEAREALLDDDVRSGLTR
ncbi:MAG: SMC family ATPase [Acidimicrobiales bacterium]